MNDSRSPIDRMRRQNPVPSGTLSGPPALGVDRIVAHERDGSDGQPVPAAASGGRVVRRPLLVAAGIVLVSGIAAAATVLVVGGGPASRTPEVPPTAQFALPPVDPGRTVFPQSSALADAAPTAPMLNFVAYSRPVSAGDLLDHLADKAQRQPAARGSGSYEFIQRRSWQLTSHQTTDGNVFEWGTTLVDHEQWRAEDGSGLDAVTENGVTRMQQVYPGPIPGANIAVDASVDAARDQLLTEGQGRDAVDWFGAVTDQWTARVVPPNVQGAFLGILADQSGIEVLGAVTDRVGREGVAVGTRTDDRQLVLVLDPTTGGLLDYEQIALDPSATELPITVPSTTSYQVWIDRGYADTVGSRP